MAEISLNIHGQSYGIACDDGQEERVRALGQHVDQRVREIASMGAATTESHLLVLASLMMADEIYDLREQLAALQQQQGQGAPAAVQPQQVTQSHSSSADEDAAAEMIGQLITRIDQVADRLAAA